MGLASQVWLNLEEVGGWVGGLGGGERGGLNELLLDSYEWVGEKNEVLESLGGWVDGWVGGRLTVA